MQSSISNSNVAEKSEGLKMDVDEEIDTLTLLGEHLVNTILEDEPIETIKSIIDNGAPLWYQNADEGLSPLHAAAFVRNEELVKFLIDEGAVWNAGEQDVLLIKLLDCD